MRSRIIACAAAALLAACGNTGGFVPRIDGGACDAQACGCSLDAECGGATPRCDRNTGRCVPCLPALDNCPRGQHCVAQNDGFICSTTCRSSADCPASDGGVALECCAGACIDTRSDRAHCGGCGNACPAVANGVPGCSAGSCGIGSCSAGFSDCNAIAADGCETAVASDTRNCGGCGKACPAVMNGAATCQAGACVPACNAGFAHCSMNPADGCEADITSDPDHCGGCGKPCAGLSHAQSACSGGVCRINGCDAGWADCDKSAATGCEVSVAGDLANCGSCGAACSTPNAVPACNAGRCSVASCNAGFADCDGLANDGCETAVDKDAMNCGACGRSCSAPHAAASCVKGSCALASCDAGYADCNANSADGCEVSVVSDLKNCGGCGRSCPVPANGTPACRNGACGVGSCAFGFGDCDGNPANGCEASLLSPMNCGACNVVCAALPNAAAACNGGACGLGACDPQWADCDKVIQNGCERSIASDTANCGACGKVCAVANATPVCKSGVCGIGQCLNGFTDCNLDPADGCEAALARDPKNCGACGKVCPAGINASASCANGVCGLACNVGWSDCDKNPANGCETTVDADPLNCGACGNVCALRKCVSNQCLTVKAISRSATASHACAVMGDTTVRCWGNNDHGQLGDGTLIARSTPVVAPGISNVTAVCPSYYSTCALLNDGTVRCWGDNAYGELGDGTFISSKSPVAVQGITNAVQLSCGNLFACARLQTGAVKCWGHNAFGQLGDGTITNRGAPVAMQGVANAVSVGSGSHSTCVALQGGSVSCTGLNDHGQIGDNTLVNRSTPTAALNVAGATAVVLGYDHACALLGDSTVRCWGDNITGQLGDGTTNNNRLTAVGVVVALGGALQSGVVELSAGHNFTCARVGNGAVLCWGTNGYGQLGDGLKMERDVPGAVVLPNNGGNLVGATQLGGGVGHGAALAGGRIMSWGDNGFGQLGDGTTTVRATSVETLF